MNITKTVNGKDFLVSLEGRLDTTTAPKFEEFIAENIFKMDTLTLDCAGLEYVSSAGLRVLLSAQKRLKDGMKLKNVCELVMEVFEMTGFVDILAIE
jgi:anti-sigma B factor antagonist